MGRNRGLVEALQAARGLGVLNVDGRAAACYPRVVLANVHRLYPECFASFTTPLPPAPQGLMTWSIFASARPQSLSPPQAPGVPRVHIPQGSSQAPRTSSYAVVGHGTLSAEQWASCGWMHLTQCCERGLQASLPTPVARSKRFYTVNMSFSQNKIQPLMSRLCE